LFFILILFVHCYYFLCYPVLRHLHSFPTRRSSDLGAESGDPQHQERSTHPSLQIRTIIPTRSHCLRRSRLNSASRSASRTEPILDRKSTRLNSSHVKISYAVFCLKKKKLQLSDMQN